MSRPARRIIMKSRRSAPARKRALESGQRDAVDSDADFVKYDYTTQGHGEHDPPVMVWML